MPTPIKRLLAGAALGCAMLSAHAGFRTVGEPDCDAWVKSPSPAHASWLMGFLSGLNTMWSEVPEPVSGITDGREFVTWMDRYCRHHPSAKISTAALTLFAELVHRTKKRHRLGLGE